ncbi:MAG: glycosyltransferase [Lachnospiraceae bacterium]|nr:glycosyltransferase [Lachnospiraceae bacterium]
MRKIFFPEWESLGQDFVIRAFKEEGFQVDLYPIPQSEPDQKKRGNLAEELVKQILAGDYEFVFTVNFLPVVAIACKACRIKYLAWVYDSPCVEVYSETVAYDTNYVFIFDRQTCFDLMKKGIKTVFYLPMAADVTFYNEVIESAADASAADISFVGSLYTETKPQFAPLENDNGYLKGYLDGLVKAQLGIYGANFLESALSPEIILKMQQICLMPQRVHSMETIAWLYANYYLAKKVTSLERTEIVRRLANQDKNFRLFTGEDTSALPGVNNGGYIDYYSQSPLVFRNSKINLNISLKSIHSGIPLRAFDIMGCGGFLLSNYQADFLEHFIPGEDFVYYESLDDLQDKVEYYLANESERCQIAKNGYDKVSSRHTYRHRIREMLEICH